MFTSIRLLLSGILVLLAVGTIRADNAGQEDLDKATETKMIATTISDLGEVIRLAESALEKGLDQPNTEFANNLLASSLLLRARATGKQILAGARSPHDFHQKRNFALSDLERAVEIDPKQPETFMLISQLNLLPNGNMERAREALEQALSLGFEEPLSQAKALMLRARLQEDPDKKMADLDEAVRLAPDKAATVRARGLLLADLDKLEPALTDLDKAIELDPDNGPIYEAKAIVLTRLKRYDEALAAIDKARQLSPLSIMPLLQRARVHTSQEKLDATLKDINEALALAPGNMGVLLMRASLYEAIGQQEKALADVDEVLKLKPNLAVAIRARVVLLSDSQRYDEALAELQKLRDLDPKDTLTLLQMAAIYNTQEKTDEVINIYTALLAEDPDEWRALRGRGDVYLNAGRQAEAIADYEMALKLEPKDYGILNNLAWVLATSNNAKLRDGKRAIELATKACEETEYKLAYMLSTLAAAYAEAGDLQSAVKWSTKAVEIGDELHGASLEKELENYKAGKPWRESLSESEPVEKNAENPGEKQ